MNLIDFLGIGLNFLQKCAIIGVSYVSKDEKTVLSDVDADRAAAGAGSAARGGDVSGSLGGVRAGGPGGSRSLRRQEPLGTVSGSCRLHRSFSGGDRRCGALVLGRADPAGQGRDPAAVRSGRRSPGRRNRAAPTSKERGRSLPAAPAARKNRTVIFHKNAEQAQCRRSTDGPPVR